MPNKRVEFVKTIMKRTGEGKLSWQSSSGSGMKTEVSGNRIVVERVERSNTIDIMITVFDVEGREIDSFTDVDLSNIEEGVMWYAHLNEMLEQGERNARGADQVLSEIIDALSRKS